MEYLVLLPKMIVKLKNGRNVPTSVTVVRGAPNSYNHVVEHQFVALHGKLVSTSNQIDSVVVRKRFGDVSAEKETCPTR